MCEEDVVGLSIVRVGKRVFHRRMPPAHAGRVLLGSVLGIVHEDVCTGGKVAAGQPSLVLCEFSATQPRLMIGHISENTAGALYTKSDSRSGMDDIIRLDLEGPDLEQSVADFMDVDLALQVSEIHREQWRRKISPKPCTQALRIARRTPDMHLCRRVEQRFEEAQSLDVVDVKMCQ